MLKEYMIFIGIEYKDTRQDAITVNELPFQMKIFHEHSIAFGAINKVDFC